MEISLTVAYVLLTVMSKPKVLFILHLPPPVHGASVMGAQIQASHLIRETFDVRFINLSSSRSLTELGKGSLRKIRFMWDLLLDVRETVRSWHPDLVYVTPTSKLPALAKDFVLVRLVGRRGCKTILHFHNKGVASRQDRWLDNFVYERLFRDTGIILISERLYPDIEKYVPRDRVYICPNGIPPLIDRLPEKGDDHVPVILFFSNLLLSKGILVLLDACCILKKQGVSFYCEVAGAETTDMDGNRLEELLREKGLQDVVHFHGPLFGPEKASLFARSDVFVLPSFNETFGLVNLEAMSAGLPVVSTREGGIPDLVQDGVTGYLCEKGSEADFSEKIRILLEDSTLRKRMGCAGRLLYEREFTGERFLERLKTVLISNV